MRKSVRRAAISDTRRSRALLRDKKMGGKMQMQYL